MRVLRHVAVGRETWTNPLPTVPHARMRLRDDCRDCVVFFGYEDDGPTGINCIGTGFFVFWDGCPYLVTARHLTHRLKDAPYLIRFNRKDGGSDLLELDAHDWFHPADPTVDLAIAPFVVAADSQYDCAYLNGSTEFLRPEVATLFSVGVGDETYTVGLFALHPGQKRNQPIVYTGSIAMNAGEEPVAVEDWTAPGCGRIVQCEAYLVNSSSFAGLSGSPVFVRPSVTWKGPEPLFDRLSQLDTYFLLGMWQSAFRGFPATPGLGSNVVPVGTGVVLPVTKIMDLLDQDDVKKHRDEIAKPLRFKGAYPD